MSEPENLGNCYWCIKSPLSPSGEIYAYADRVEINSSGDLLLISRKGNSETDLLIVGFAREQWLACFAASVMDGSPVGVDRWQGEIERDL